MVSEKLLDKFTKYEIARILGARSLQLAMDAPILLKMTKEDEENLNWDSLKIAEKELETGVLPITVKRPMPKKSQKTIKKLSEEEIKEKIEKQAKEETHEEIKEVSEESEEGRIEKEEEIKEEVADEIMEMATPEDEIEGGEEEGFAEEAE